MFPNCRLHLQSNKTSLAPSAFEGGGGYLASGNQNIMKQETFTVHLSTPTRPKNLSGVKKVAIYREERIFMKLINSAYRHLLILMAIIYRVKTKGKVVDKKV